MEADRGKSMAKSQEVGILTNEERLLHFFLIGWKGGYDIGL